MDIKEIKELNKEEIRQIDGGFLILTLAAINTAVLVGLYGLAEAGFKAGYEAS